MVLAFLGLLLVAFLDPELSFFCFKIFHLLFKDGVYLLLRIFITLLLLRVFLKILQNRIIPKV